MTEILFIVEEAEEGGYVAHVAATPSTTSARGSATLSAVTSTTMTRSGRS